MSMKEMLQAARQKRLTPTPAAAIGATRTEEEPTKGKPPAGAAPPAGQLGQLSPAQQAEVSAYRTRDFDPSPDAASSHRLAENCLTSGPSLPRSCYLIPDFLSSDESSQLLSLIDSSPACMWHQLKRRRLQMWGGFPTPTASGEAFRPDPLPQWQERLIDRMCATVDAMDSTLAATAAPPAAAAAPSVASPSPFFPASLRPNHVLLNQYESGQGIMAHQDGPAYESRVAILSLGSHTVMRFYKDLRDAQPATHAPALSVYVPPRSLLIFTDELYQTFFHAIEELTQDELTADIANAPPALVGQTIERQTRVSLTIRRVKN